VGNQQISACGPYLDNSVTESNGENTSPWRWLWVGMIPRNVGEHPTASGIDNDPKRRSASPENSAGRERLFRSSHNTAGRDLNLTSLQSGAAAHPLAVTLESAWSTKLSECLGAYTWCDCRCDFGDGALLSSMLVFTGLIVVNGKILGAHVGWAWTPLAADDSCRTGCYQYCHRYAPMRPTELHYTEANGVVTFQSQARCHGMEYERGPLWGKDSTIKTPLTIAEKGGYEAR
jgi:hypothetical protein